MNHTVKTGTQGAEETVGQVGERSLRTPAVEKHTVLVSGASGLVGSSLVPFSISETTDSNGMATFAPLPSGIYSLSETLPDGTWVNTASMLSE